MEAGANELIQIIEQGGAIAVLVLAVLYLAAQNHRLAKRNERLVDRMVEQNARQAALAASTHATLDKLAERIRA